MHLSSCFLVTDTSMKMGQKKFMLIMQVAVSWAIWVLFQQESEICHPLAILH